MTTELSAYLAFVRKASSTTRFDLSRSGMPSLPVPTGSDSQVNVDLPELHGVTVSTRGASGAVFLALLAASISGLKRVAYEVPSYPIFAAVAKGLGLVELPIRHRTEAGAILEAAGSAIDAGAEILCLQDPHNPSGYEMSETERRLVIGLCSAAGVWLVVDRVFADFAEVPVGYGESDEVFIARSYSKSLGLGPERFGWLSAPPRMRIALERAVDTIQGQPMAIDPSVRRRLSELAASQLARNLGLVRSNNERLLGWLQSRRDVTSVVEPRSLPFATLRIRDMEDSDRLASRLLAETGTAVVPGPFFGLAQNEVRVGLTSPDFALGLAHLSEAITQGRGNSPSPRR